MGIIEEAKMLFHGTEMYNCAQAVLKAFQDTYEVPPEQVVDSSRLGGGRAEQGMCGALYAAESLVADPVKRAVLRERFRNAAGAVECRAIRAVRKLSCRECVEKAAELILEIDGAEDKPES
ncbi:MAG TPA: C-GCAxxG-C-C family protein [Spirochaetota bacterium]|nr:C-GCAxxG-C-C family protein [Spirochaetota bacterium]